MKYHLQSMSFSCILSGEEFTSWWASTNLLLTRGRSLWAREGFRKTTPTQVLLRCFGNNASSSWHSSSILISEDRSIRESQAVTSGRTWYVWQPALKISPRGMLDDFSVEGQFPRAPTSLLSDNEEVTLRVKTCVRRLTMTVKPYTKDWCTLSSTNLLLTLDSSLWAR